MQKNIFMTLNPSIREGLLLKYAKKKNQQKYKWKVFVTLTTLKF